MIPSPKTDNPAPKNSRPVALWMNSTNRLTITETIPATIMAIPEIIKEKINGQG